MASECSIIEFLQQLDSERKRICQDCCQGTCEDEIDYTATECWLDAFNALDSTLQGMIESPSEHGCGSLEETVSYPGVPDTVECISESYLREYLEWAEGIECGGYSCNEDSYPECGSHCSSYVVTISGLVGYYASWNGAYTLDYLRNSEPTAARCLWRKYLDGYDFEDETADRQLDLRIRTQPATLLPIWQLDLSIKFDEDLGDPIPGTGLCDVIWESNPSRSTNVCSPLVEDGTLFSINRDLSSNGQSGCPPESNYLHATFEISCAETEELP